MTVYELNNDELNELKETYACQLNETDNDISYGELLDAHSIPDDVVYNHYDGINFTKEDFYCNCKEG